MGDRAAVIDGDGVLADALRGAVVTTECATTVVVAGIAATATRFDEIDDEFFDAAWEQPMQRAIIAFQTAHRDKQQRIIAIVPTIGMSGAAGLSAAAATAEAVRALVKSAARQWGADGITVNTIAVAPELFGIRAEDVGAVSLAPPALATKGAVVADLVPIVRLLGSEAAHHITGSTLTADGGVWMSP